MLGQIIWWWCIAGSHKVAASDLQKEVNGFKREVFVFLFSLTEVTLNQSYINLVTMVNKTIWKYWRVPLYVGLCKSSRFPLCGHGTFNTFIFHIYINWCNFHSCKESNHKLFFFNCTLNIFLDSVGWKAEGMAANVYITVVNKVWRLTDIIHPLKDLELIKEWQQCICTLWQGALRRVQKRL